MVTLHRGIITASSAGEGCGSTFAVEIPLLQSSAHKTHNNVDIDSEYPNNIIDWNYLEGNHQISEDRNVIIDQLEINRNETTDFCGFADLMNLSYDYTEKAGVKDDRAMNALVVDDSCLSRKMMRRLWCSKHGTVCEAQDGLEAVEMVKNMLDSGQDMVDVILMDFQMPNMDGPSAAKAIRELGYIGIIVGVTGNALPVDIEHFKRCGANTVLMKPIDLDALDEFLAGTHRLNLAIYNSYVFNFIS